jgi:hypothetical protein
MEARIFLAVLVLLYAGLLYAAFNALVCFGGILKILPEQG